MGCSPIFRKDKVEVRERGYHKKGKKRTPYHRLSGGGLSTPAGGGRQERKKKEGRGRKKMRPSSSSVGGLSVKRKATRGHASDNGQTVSMAPEDNLVKKKKEQKGGVTTPINETGPRGDNFHVRRRRKDLLSSWEKELGGRKKVSTREGIIRLLDGGVEHKGKKKAGA